MCIFVPCVLHTYILSEPTNNFEEVYRSWSLKVISIRCSTTEEDIEQLKLYQHFLRNKTLRFIKEGPSNQPRIH